MQGLAARRVFALVMLLAVTGALFRAQPAARFMLLLWAIYFGMQTIWPSRFAVGRGDSILSAILFAGIAVGVFVSGHAFYEFDLVAALWLAGKNGWEAMQDKEWRLPADHPLWFATAFIACLYMGLAVLRVNK